MTKFPIIVMLLLSFLYGKSQDAGFNFNYHDILFEDFIDSLEYHSPFKVYYSHDWVDSLIITLEIENGSVDQIFTEILNGTDLSYLVAGNRVIMTSNFPVKTSFLYEIQQYLTESQDQADTLWYDLEKSASGEEPDINEEFKVFKIGTPSEASKQGRVALSGFIRDANTGDPVIGAVVYDEKLKVGAVTDETGFYTIELTRGPYRLEFRTIGMRTTYRNIILYSEGTLDVRMIEKTTSLDEVTISADRENKVYNLRLGVEKINVKMLKQIPMGMGEVDLIKSTLQLPGVQSVGEASAGFNVRGGSVDQNLILLDYAPIMNTAHFFGFFSAFNSDLVEEITLYKSGIPAKFGGRISSVMDIQLKEGNPAKYRVSGGISPVTGRIMVEGPLVENKSSFAISARGTYSDWILGLLNDKQLQQSSGSFYDIQGVVNYDLNDDNRFSISGYYSKDRFDYYKESGFEYSNLAGTIKWRHHFKSNFYADFAAILSNYTYQLDNKEDSTAFSSMEYTLNQDIFRADFTYLLHDHHKLEFGLDATFFNLMPGAQKPLNALSEVVPKTLERERGLLAAFYAGDEIEFSSRFSMSGGVRFSLFSSLGPKTAYNYYDGVPKSIETISDTIHYSGGEVIALQPGIGFRISSRYILSPKLSVKAGIHRMYQYIHMISNTTAMSPTDIWKLSDQNLPPQRGDQFTVGLYQNLAKNTVEASVEAYYKRLKNIIDYKGGAQLLMNEHLETDLLNGVGKAYGVEFMLKKSSGMLTGWISYTYSRILHRVNGSFEEETINSGNYFPANYDKPHDVKLVANLRLSRRINTTANFVYNTGRPITYPVAFYQFSSTNQIFYSNRNEFRVPDYIRLDLAMTLNGNLRRKKLNHSSLTLAVYNVFGRKNPYSIYFKVEDGAIQGYQMSIFGRPIITLTYNFKLFGNASDDY